MFRKVIFTIGASIALTAQPLAAQDTAEVDPFAALTGMFEVEPLTAEQEARLPLAKGIVDKMIPDGAMREMMEGMFSGSFGDLMSLGAMMEEESPAAFVAGQLGLEQSDISLTSAQASELANMFDPARLERKQKEAEIMPGVMGEMMDVMEPPMRKAMSELYAIHFTQPQLVEIDGFFSTETGAIFARKSFTMASDPRVMSATMEALPAMMGQIGAIEKKMKEAAADLPAARSFEELSEQEQARISELTGFPVDNLREWSVASGDDYEDDYAMESKADEKN
ncbi:DUF2059 domain-containing protein [Pontixanthobacter aquaemixtae]|uniref:DUF2059 domain-containing protein n=1 Tax=Pontixanthobacter aquaemixtae TaxID=1958940 RepID=A0A844ZUX1_9SPHN|nr:hypothetical protein [Pontixanthobacter aquaemixtae]MXO91274.1 hypothetical protein [Pontixanthobacter aquaemixtae]